MRVRWAVHVTQMGTTKNTYGILGEKPERTRTLGSPKHRSEDNIKMGLKEIVCEVVDWVVMTQAVVW
jgi:hypothetical protein